jgi:hypothetical protein
MKYLMAAHRHQEAAGLHTLRVVVRGYDAAVLRGDDERQGRTVAGGDALQVLHERRTEDETNRNVGEPQPLVRF